MRDPIPSEKVITGGNAISIVKANTQSTAQPLCLVVVLMIKGMRQLGIVHDLMPLNRFLKNLWQVNDLNNIFHEINKSLACFTGFLVNILPPGSTSETKLGRQWWITHRYVQPLPRCRALRSSIRSIITGHQLPDSSQILNVSGKQAHLVQGRRLLENTRSR